MNEPLGKTELSDILTSLKKLVADDPEAEASRKEEQHGFKKKLFLGPALRVADDQKIPREASGGAHSLQDKILRLEELISHAEGLWDPDNAGKGAYAGRSVSGLPWKKFVDTATSDFDLPMDLNAIYDEGAISGPEPEVLVENDLAPDLETDARDDYTNNPETNVEETMLPLNLEKLKQVVSEVLREDLRGPTGEKITSNIRRLVREEIEAILRSSNSK